MTRRHNPSWIGLVVITILLIADYIGSLAYIALNGHPNDIFLIVMVLLLLVALYIKETPSRWIVTISRDGLKDLKAKDLQNATINFEGGIR